MIENRGIPGTGCISSSKNSPIRTRREISIVNSGIPLENLNGFKIVGVIMAKIVRTEKSAY